MGGKMVMTTVDYLVIFTIMAMAFISANRRKIVRVFADRKEDRISKIL